MAKGEIADKAPIKIEVEAGKDYWWCSCGRSSNQPFCDGSHKGSEFSPVKWTAEEGGDKWFCACKQTDGQPFCDGSHNALDAEPAAAEAVIIEQREDGPLVVKNLTALTGPNGKQIECKPVMALCRCGQSKNKPFCDGSHKDAGFRSAPDDVEKRDRVYTYEGKDITVHYNKLLCSHAGECAGSLRAVFDPSRKPWVMPDEGTAEDIKDVVARCPSGALRYSEAGADPSHIDPGEISVTIERHGAYHVKNAELAGDLRWADGASRKKVVLCRCGLSANKPFCDGSHYEEKWRDGS